MSTLQVLDILFVGRKPNLAQGLLTLFEQRNRGGASLPSGQQRSIEFQAVTNQKSALDAIRSRPPSAILVEIDKRSDSRVRFCEMVRYRLPTAAILAIAGAKPETSFAFDGFIKLPLLSHQVFAAIDQVQSGCVDHLLQRGPLSLNIASRTVITPKGAYAMTPKQCALLQMLMLNHGQIVKRSEIMQLIWETSYLEDTRTLDVHIRWLRERIEPDPSNPLYLTTVRGVGYRLSLF
jgi:DNA-binding response OmpR family regulator